MIKKLLAIVFTCVAVITLFYFKRSGVTIPTNSVVLNHPAAELRTPIHGEVDANQSIQEMIAFANTSDTFTDFKRLLDDVTNGHIAIESLDKPFQEYLSDTSVPKNKKLAMMWRLFKESQGTSATYVLDSLSILEPIEITDELIQAFSETADAQIKQHLVTIISDLSTVAEIPETDSQQYKFLAHQSESIQTFFKSIIESEDNLTIRRQAVLDIPRVFPVAMAVSLVEKVSLQSNMSNDDEPVPLITSPELASLWFEIAFSSEESQAIYLSKAIETLEAVSIVDDDLKSKLVSIVANAPLSSNAEVKTQIQKALNMIRLPSDGDIETYKWVQANATAISSSEAEKETYILTVLNSGRVEEKISILNHSDQGIDKLSQEQRKQLSETIRIESDSPSVSPELRAYAEQALFRLSEHTAVNNYFFAQ